MQSPIQLQLQLRHLEIDFLIFGIGFIIQKLLVFQNQNTTKLASVSYNHSLLVSISNVLQTLF